MPTPEALRSKMSEEEIRMIAKYTHWNEFQVNEALTKQDLNLTWSLVTILRDLLLLNRIKKNDETCVCAIVAFCAPIMAFNPQERLRSNRASSQ